MATAGFVSLLSAGFLIALTSAALALATGLRDAPSLILTAYLAAWLETLALTIGLTTLGVEVSRSSVLIGALFCALLAAVVWKRRGSPWPCVPRRPRQLDPAVVALAFVVAAALLYELVLAVATPPSNPDSLWYHLVRAALWRQEGGVAQLEYASNPFVNSFPPNGEAGVLLTMVLSGTDGAAQLVQLLAELALIVGVYGLARRLAFDRQPSLFAALLVASLPLVALESSTTQNDLVAASFVAATVFFLFGTTRLDTVLAGVAFGLGLGTKLSFLLAVPAILLVVMVVRRGHLKTSFLALLGGALVLGSFGFVRNLVETGELFGKADAGGHLRADGTVGGFLTTLGQMAYRTLDLSGLVAVGQPSWVPLVATGIGLGAVVCAVVVACRLARVPTPELTRSVVVVAIAVPAGVAATVALAGLLELVLQALGVQPGSKDVPGSFEFDINLRASEDSSAFGVVGGLLVLPLALWTVLRARKNPKTAVVGAALPIALLMLAGTLAYNDYDMRYVIGPTIVSAVLCASAYRHRTLRLAIVGVAGTMLVSSLLLNHAKPVGIGPGAGVFSLSRAELQTRFAPAMRSTVLRLDRVAKAGAVVRLDLGPDDFGYPFFGAALDRTIVYRGDSRRPDWIVIAPAGASDAWRVVAF